MGYASRSLRRPGAILVMESMLVAAILCFTSAVTPARALDPTSPPSPVAEPSPTLDPGLTPDPAATPGPGVTPDPAITPDPAATPDPLPTPDPGTSPDPAATPDPGTSPDPPASADPGAAPTVDPGPTPTVDPAATPAPAPAPGVMHVDHTWVDGIDIRTGLDLPGAVDTPAAAFDRGRLYVVRFQLVNETDAPINFQPSLEFASAVAPDAWVLVPAVDPVAGVPFYTSANVRRGEKPDTAPILVGDLRLATSSDAGGGPVTGASNVGVNPGPAVSLPAHGFTEIAFTIRATADAPWLAAYAVRLTDGGAPIAGVGLVSIVMRDSPPVVLSPGQQSGLVVDDPLPMYRLRVPGSAFASASGGATGPALPAAGPLAPSFPTPHGSYSLTTDACAACHSTHTAQSTMLLVRPAPQSSMCFVCHNGTGASTNIAAQYSDLTVPLNNAATDSWFSHAATTPSNHTSDRDPGEFAGVLNRHTACTDCHQPHLADSSLATETATGWTASGALKGAAGVVVQNGAAGTAPTYTLARTSEFEYQLCFKCHSGFTQLNPPTGPPSTWALDKAVELNPANLSYHPVEAPGKNATAQMTNSLAGTSPYKLWTFTTNSTIRCVNCHGDSRLANPASPPAAGARLAPHAVVNRGMLLLNLRDRVLKGPSEAYAAADFALCYACHAEAPLLTPWGTPSAGTNFQFHGQHLTQIASYSGPPVETVDTVGAGYGNALCAECHFRTHGTTYAVNGQTPGSRLVNFAPDVQPYQGPEPAYAGQLVWDASTHTCTLTCHGVNHKARSY